MTIGELAAAVKLSAGTIRHYEGLGLIEAQRMGNGYRKFCECDVHRLRFVQHARGLGYTVGQCRDVLALIQDDQLTNNEIVTRVLAEILEVDGKLSELKDFHQTLTTLLQHACETDIQ